MPHAPLSWLDYMDELKLHASTTDLLHAANLETIASVNDLTSTVLKYNAPAFYLLDYRTGNYLLIAKSMHWIIGYGDELVKGDGLSITLENYDRDHLQLFNHEIFPDRIKFLQSVPLQDHARYLFTYNFRFRTNTGLFVNLLQRNCFIQSDAQGNPLLSFGVITNVDHYVGNNPVIQTIEKMDKDQPPFSKATLLFKRKYYINKEDQLFTKRELEVLKWMADGLTSKEVATKLFISEYTVINHRRNMFEKAHAKNMTQLIRHALVHQLI